MEKKVWLVRKKGRVKRVLQPPQCCYPTRARAQGWKETLLDFYWATWEIGFSNVLYFNLGGNFRGPEIQFKISNVLIT